MIHFYTLGYLYVTNISYNIYINVTNISYNIFMYIEQCYVIHNVTKNVTNNVI